MFSYNDKRSDGCHPVSKYATFNTEEFQIPRGAIYVVNTNIYHDFEEPYALANTISLLIEDNHGKAFIGIDSDSVPASDLRAYYYLPLTECFKLFTHWSDWLDDSAIAKLFYNVGNYIVDNESYSSLADFKHVFDDTSRLPPDKPVAHLVPSFAVACDYLVYLCKERPEEHQKFSDIVDSDLKAAVLAEINKMKNKAKSESLDIDMQELTNQKRKEIIEGAAQHMVMGIIARALNRPIRCFAREANYTMRYVENVLLGTNANNELAIQTITISFIESIKSIKMKGEDNLPEYFRTFTDFFKKNSSYYQEIIKHRYTESQSVIAGAKLIKLDVLLQKVTGYLQSVMTPLHLLEMVVQEVNFAINYLKQTNTGGRSCQSSAKELYWVSSDSPSGAELFLHLRAYLASGRASLNRLERFANELSCINSMRTGNAISASMPLTPKQKLPSSYLATFDTERYTIPKGAILADGICVKKVNNAIEIDECNTGEYLSALLNTANRLIADYHAVAWMVLVSDTLAATNAGDHDVSAYQEAGRKFLANHRRFYSALSLHQSDIHYMTWESWRHMPSFDESYRDLCQRSESGEFKAIADVIINDFVNAEVGKLRHQGEPIDLPAIIKRKRAYLLEEATQYYMLGELAKMINRPIRFLHKGTNALFTFIEEKMVGRLPNGELAIQLIDIKFIYVKNLTTFFNKNATYYQPTKLNAEPIHRTLTSVASETARVSLLLNALVHLMAGNAPANLLAMVLVLIKYNIEIKRNYCYLERFQYSSANSLFKTSSSEPDQGEVFFHLMEYLESPAMTKEALQSLKVTLKSELHSLRRK